MWMAIVVSVLVVLAPLQTWAASHYIRAGATGANNGSSWADAWTEFPSGTTYIRGDEYYVAVGTYTTQSNFSTVPSGTTTIKVCKATIAIVGSCSTAHGSDTGWSDTYAAQALFTNSGVNPFFSPGTSGYFIFDGVTGTGTDTASYGFYLTPSGGGGSYQVVTFHGPSNVVTHMAITCPGAAFDVEQLGFYNAGNAGSVLSFVYADQCQVSAMILGTGPIIEYSYFKTHWSSGSHHGVHVEANISPIFRNNVLADCGGGPCFEPNSGNLTNGAFYNNVFIGCTTPNGVLKGTSADSIIDTVMYNNTVVNCAGPILYQNNEGLGAGSGNTVVNNLFYNSSPQLINEGGAGTIAHSYNSLYDHTAGNPPAETGIQIGSGNPFVNSAGGDFHLAVTADKAIDLGFSLSQPYNLDADGLSRPQGSAWDIGAYEFDQGGAGQSPDPPTGGTFPADQRPSAGSRPAAAARALR